MQVHTDELTIVRAQGGNRAAQTHILRAHSRALRHLVSRVRAPGDLDDQMQELYTKILTALPKFRIDGTATLSTWIYSVAHHFLIDSKRRYQPKLVQLNDETPDDTPLGDSLLQRKLDQALRKLPEEQRRIFVLAQILEQPLEEIATQEGLPLGTVKSRLHRARADLIEQLKEEKSHVG